MGTNVKYNATQANYISEAGGHRGGGGSPSLLILNSPLASSRTGSHCIACYRRQNSDGIVCVMCVMTPRSRSEPPPARGYFPLYPTPQSPGGILYN
jgi:hypothetical protein